MARIVSLLVFKGAELFGKAFDFLSFFFTFQNSWHKYCISGIQRRRVLRYQGNYNSDEEVCGTWNCDNTDVFDARAKKNT